MTNLIGSILIWLYDKNCLDTLSCPRPAQQDTGMLRPHDMMTLLHIAFQKGFVQDSIILRVNGTTVLEQLHVQSRWQTGFACEVDLPVAQGAIALLVVIPTRTESKTIHLEITEKTYLGISLTSSGSITYMVSARPFEYF